MNQLEPVWISVVVGSDLLCKCEAVILLCCIAYQVNCNTLMHSKSQCPYELILLTGIEILCAYVRVMACVKCDKSKMNFLVKMLMCCGERMKSSLCNCQYTRLT